MSNSIIRYIFTLCLLCLTTCYALAQSDLTERVHGLPEITVTVKPIEQKGDTINYNVAAFKDDNDHYLIDILKKLPGVEIADDGHISYKGTSINNFNIEGQDLLGSRYNQATKNLPIDAVSQIQVMENDQPIQVLRNRTFSEKATLNVKLKRDYKHRPFGEISINGGYGEELLFKGDATLINVGRKNQSFTTLKTNNIGEDISDLTTGHLDVTNLSTYMPLPSDLITNMYASTLSISKKRYLSNKSISAAINHQIRLGKYSTWRNNVLWYGSRDELRDSSQNNYYGSYEYSLSTTNQTIFKHNIINASSRYELNAPNAYVSEEVVGSIGWESPFGKLLSNAYDVSQQITRKPICLKNQFQVTLKDSKRTYQILSLSRFYSNNEELSTASLYELYNISAEYHHTHFASNNKVTTSFVLFHNSLDLSYNLNYKKESVGELSVNNLSNSLECMYSFRYKTGLITFNIPFRVLHFTNSCTSHSQNKVYISPSVLWRHNFNAKLFLKTNINIRNEEQENLYIGQYIRSDYRTRRSYADSLGCSKVTSYSAMLNYSDMASMFIWSFMGSFSARANDFYDEYTYTNNYTDVRPLWNKAHYKSLFLTTVAEKTFRVPRLILKTNISYNRIKAPFNQNGENEEIYGNVFTVGVTMSWTKLQWLKMSFQSIGNLSWQDYYKKSNSTLLKNWQSLLNVTVLPNKQVKIHAEWEREVIETSKSQFYRISFIDIGAEWKMSKRISINLNIHNLLNQKKYCTSTYNGLTYFYYENPLRGAESLLGIQFNL